METSNNINNISANISEMNLIDKNFFSMVEEILSKKITNE